MNTYYKFGSQAALEKYAGVGDALRTLLTGRTTLYHGTSAGRGKQILQEGLRPQGASGVSSLFPGLDEAQKGLAFTTRSRGLASEYAMQQGGIERLDKMLSWAKEHVPGLRPKIEALHSDATPKPWIRAAVTAAGVLPGAQKVIEARVPRALVAAQRAGQPELVGPNMAVHRAQVAEKARAIQAEAKDLTGAKKQLAELLLHPEAQAALSLSPQMAATFMSAVPLRGGVPAQYIHGSPHYQGVTLDELRAHLAAARQDPRGLGKDVLRSLLGVQSRPSTVIREHPLPEAAPPEIKRWGPKAIRPLPEAAPPEIKRWGPKAIRRKMKTET